MEHESKRDLWKVTIRGWAESGLSQREYCFRQSLTYSAFRYWYRHFGSGNEQTESNRRVRAVEVSRKAMKPHTAAMNPVENGEIETDKIVIKIPGTEATVTISGLMSLATLNRILGVFRGIDSHAEA